MSNRFLVEAFERWRAAGDDLVLATVVRTEGSTYSKRGRQLLIDPRHRYAGLVGGGCLEGDLVLRADSVLASGEPQLVTYDMRDDADDLWGMGLGCRGMMQLLLQRLDSENNWEPFSRLSSIMAGSQPTTVALTIQSSGDIPAGQLTDPAGGVNAVRWTVRPWPRLLILGAGPDTGPVVQIARTLGWHVTVADHRPKLLAAEYLARADDTVSVVPQKLNDSLQPERYHAVCVMSHHLPSDYSYLQTLREYAHDYVGVLGPKARRDELLQQLDKASAATPGTTRTAEFTRRLRGPVGLDIGAASPQGIALALIAEIHAALATAGRTDP